MRYSTSFLLCVAGFQLSAQQPIKGEVQDELGQPLIGATITLKDMEGTKVLVHGQSDIKGHFVLPQVKSGKYKLTVAYITYTQVEQVIEVNKQPIGNLLFQLFPEAQLLEAVSITGTKKPVMSISPGKATLNVAQSNLAQSQSAFDLLKTLPGVNVNKDGDIRIKGKSGVMVMMDGQPVEMTGAQLKNMLKGTPGTTLQAIEVLNNAPASMDAAGTGGVINLLFKKKVKQGFDGSLNSTVAKGTYYNQSHSMDLRYGSEKWKHSLLYAYDYEKSNDRDSTFRFEPGLLGSAQAKDFQMSQVQRNPNRSKSHLLKLATDFQFTEKQSVGLNMTFNDLRNPTDGQTFTRFGMRDTQDSILQQTNYLRSKLKNVDYGIKYRYQLKEQDHILASAQFNRLEGNGFEDYTIAKSIPAVSTIFHRRYRNLYPSTVNRKIFKIDYLKELKNGEEKVGKVEAGLKTTMTRIQSTQTRENKNANQWLIDPLHSQRFDYREAVHAAYVAMELQAEPWTVNIGMRGEYTRIKGAVTGEENNVRQHYFSLFPNALLGYKVSDSYALSLAYSRRIERPDYDKLNPSVRYLDAYTTMQGNPRLKPQFSSNLEFNQQFLQFIDLSLGYSSIKDPINTTFISSGGAQSMYTMLNTGKQQQWEASLSFPIPGIDWWENYQSVYVYNSQFNATLGDQNYKARANSFGAVSYNAFKLPKQFSIELTAWYESGGIYANFRYKPTSEVSVGVSKKVLNDRLTMTLALTDAFYGSKFRAAVLSNTSASTFMLSKWDSRQAKFSLNWNLGKSKKGQTQPEVDNQELPAIGRGKKLPARSRL